jgi:hypothetical protein
MLAVVPMMAVMPMVAMPMPVAAEVQSDARAVTIAAVVVRRIAIAPYASAAVHMPAVTPATAAPPDFLRQRIFTGRRRQTTCSVAERGRLGTGGKHAERNCARRSTQPM